MTTGVLLQKIVSAKSLMEFTHVFIDEVSALLPGQCAVLCLCNKLPSELFILVRVNYLFYSFFFVSRNIGGILRSRRRWLLE